MASEAQIKQFAFQQNIPIGSARQIIEAQQGQTTRQTFIPGPTSTPTAPPNAKQLEIQALIDDYSRRIALEKQQAGNEDKIREFVSRQIALQLQFDKAATSNKSAATLIHEAEKSGGIWIEIFQGKKVQAAQQRQATRQQQENKILNEFLTSGRGSISEVESILRRRGQLGKNENLVGSSVEGGFLVDSGQRITPTQRTSVQPTILENIFGMSLQSQTIPQSKFPEKRTIIDRIRETQPVKQTIFQTQIATTGLQSFKGAISDRVPAIGSFVDRGNEDFFGLGSKIKGTPEQQEQKAEFLETIDIPFDIGARPFLKLGKGISETEIPRTQSTIGSLLTPGFAEGIEVEPESAEELISGVLKFGFFGRIITSGAAAKQVQKTKGKSSGKTTSTSGVKFGQSEIEKAIGESFIRGRTQDLREIVRRALKTGNKKIIRDTKKLMDNAIGEANSNLIWKDVIEQEGFILAGTQSEIIGTSKPSIVQPGGKGESLFAGKGTFERTEFFGTGLRGAQDNLRLSGVVSGGVSSGREATGLLDRQSALSGSVLSLFGGQKSKEGLQPRFGLVSGLSLGQQQGLQQQQQQQQRQLQQTRQLQQQRTQQQTRQQQNTITKLTPRFPRPIRTGGPRQKPEEGRPGKPFGFLIPFRDRPGGKKEIGYHGFVKSGKKFVRVTKQPTSRTNALARAAYLTDTSTARSFKVAPTKKKIKRPKKTDTYSGDTRFKYRAFQQKRGARQRTPNKFIERSAFAIDTPSEVKGIPLAGRLASKRKRNSRSSIRRLIG